MRRRLYRVKEGLVFFTCSLGYLVRCWTSPQSVSLENTSLEKKLEELRGKLAYYCLLPWGYLVGLLFRFWFGLFFGNSYYKLKVITTERRRIF